MPLSITSLARHNGSACQHLNITVNLDGTSVTFTVDQTRVANMMQNITFAGTNNYKILLLMLLARYRLERGATLANLASQVTIS